MKFEKVCIPKTFKDMTGLRFGLIRVKARSGSNAGGKATWVCDCDCGKEFVCTGDALRLGQYSCGCTHLKSRTHGLSESSEYRIWRGMIQRCTNKKLKAYKSYGGRGIEVCDRWMKFENFYADMGKRPESHSIERINNDGNYEKDNCEWIKKAKQARNKRNVFLTDGKTYPEIAKELGIEYSTLRYRVKHGVPLDKRVGGNFITFNGESLNLAQWSRKLGIPRTTIMLRYKKGWSVDRILKAKK